MNSQRKTWCVNPSPAARNDDPYGLLIAGKWSVDHPFGKNNIPYPLRVASCNFWRIFDCVLKSARNGCRLIFTALAIIASPFNASLADQFDDARIILDSGNGLVRKWTYPPRFVVVYSGKFNRDALNETLDAVEKSTMLGPSEFNVTYIDVSELSSGKDGLSRYSLEPRIGSDDLYSGEISVGGRPAISGEIFLFSAPAMELSYYAVVVGSAQSAGKLARQVSGGDVDCYFDAASHEGRVQLSYIFISTDAPEDFQKKCIYEEVVQSFGLFNDAAGSDAFTFDDQSDDNELQNDMDLLSSLYSSSIKPEDKVDRVISIYKQRIAARKVAE